jgi:hypothetical protein
VFKVHVGFGFHVNLYHSFREDTNDQKGFAGDIRVIRHIIAVLNKYNAAGIPVKATWDFENAFSLEEVLPVYAPDIIENVRVRVKERGDEPILMGYNNGAMGALTREELEASVKWAVTNEKASGILDVFGKYEPVLRPQEIMFSPSQALSYSEIGIDALCLYYSSVPFDGFRTLVPLLPEKFAFNPLNYCYKDSKITIMPTYNNGDLIDFGSIKSLAKKLHNKQKNGEIDADVFIFINMDADSEFWYGYNFPFPLSKLPNLCGIDGLVGELAGLPFVEFDTPGNYLKTHRPLKDITFTFDIADGNFDGYSSWSEKPFNRQIWTRIDRARALKPKKGFEKEAFLKRIRLLSTTHFGLSTPHLNTRREKKALDLSREMLSLMEPGSSAAQEDQSRWTSGETDGIRYCLPKSGRKYKDDSHTAAFGHVFSAKSQRIQYRGREFNMENVKQTEIGLKAADYNISGFLYEAEINLSSQIEGGTYRHALYTVQGLDGIFSSLKIKYPYTREDAYVFNEIAALQRMQDDGWTEVCPYEICAGPAKGAIIIKRNYEGDISEYNIDDFSAADPLNTEIDSFNHQVTNGFVGVRRAGGGGFLLAAQKQIANSMAFCPMRVRDGNLYLNPFGTYYGKQRHHATHGSGLGARIAVYSAPQFFPLAPSYNGACEEFMLGIFPFKEEPESGIWEQAAGFCEGSIPQNETMKDFCVPRMAVNADTDAGCKKITAGIPVKLQARVMLNGIKSILGA